MSDDDFELLEDGALSGDLTAEEQRRLLEEVRASREGLTQARRDAVEVFRCWRDDMPLAMDTRARLCEWAKQWPEPEVK